MSKSNNNKSNPLENYTDEQFENLSESINDLELYEKKRLEQEQIEADEIIKVENLAYRRIRISFSEIINRIFFFFFIFSFLFSFASIYLLNKLWFLLYLISAFSCILYTPNRKALKELIAAWPNIEDLIRNRSLWRR
tara:strand:- start:787 stop:1197 length:411 start_codon:yes stop_codon:yes gene_type:complete